jgi:TPR repeat protein
MHTPRYLIALLLVIGSMSAQAASRLERLQQSLTPTAQTVPGVTRGLEGDPRGETWASRCDREKIADACWLVAIELAPMFSFAGYAGYRYQDPGKHRLAVQYLNRACDLGSAEGCADLGDFYRFNYPDSKHGEFRADLRIALESYKKSCALDSAYGCYVLAEFNDRGIATAPDPALARSQFQELCSAGLSVACYRATQSPAPVYPYKVYSALDSSCGTNEDCWAECKNGTWGACGKIDSREFTQTLTALSTTENEWHATQAKACAAGADWGCKGPQAASKPLLVDGCKAGSEVACLAACTTFADVKAELECEKRRRTFAGVDFVDKSIGQRMRECFGGGARGCFDFLPIVHGSRQVPLTAAEQSAYVGSQLIFYRMACNAGNNCRFLADHYRSTDPNRAWAYELANGEVLMSERIVQVLTPIERAISHRVLVIDPLKSLPEDVVAFLDQACSAGRAHPCAVLAEFFQNIALSVRPNEQRGTWATLLKNYEGLEANEQLAHDRCDNLPAGSWVGTIMVVQTPATDACHRKVAKDFDQLRKNKAAAEQSAEAVPATIFEYDVARKQKALDYWSKSCSLGHAFACNAFTSLLSMPNQYAR